MEYGEHFQRHSTKRRRLDETTDMVSQTMLIEQVIDSHGLDKFTSLNQRAGIRPQSTSRNTFARGTQAGLSPFDPSMSTHPTQVHVTFSTRTSSLHLDGQTNEQLFYTPSNLNAYTHSCQMPQVQQENVLPTPSALPSLSTLIPGIPSSNGWAGTSPLAPYPVPSDHSYPRFTVPNYLERSLSQQAPSAESTSTHNLPWPSCVETGTQSSGEPSNLIPEDPKTDNGKIVCFGMVPPISGKCAQQAVAAVPSPFLVTLESSSAFQAISIPEVRGCISSDPWQKQMIQDLMNDDTLILFISCSIDELPDARKPAKKFAQVSCNLEITVYGPLTEFDELGSWFQQHEVYLQDPLECHRDTRYCNPHKLSSEDFSLCPTVSEIVSQLPCQSQIQDITDHLDPLDALSTRGELEEACQPRAIRAQLKRHQKQALTFMLRRENGWGFQDGHPDIWTVMADTAQNQFFVNMVSGAHQIEEPPQFYGGIIADPMGLGKTLTMIALAAYDLELNLHNNAFELDEDELLQVPTTLIIIPPPLLGSWEEQLLSHVMDGAMKYRRHHGKSRLTNADEVGELNIVLTTYQTVTAEWKSKRGVGHSALFGVRWRRVILDEAHYIRNESSQVSRAVCSINARSRWAVTGTPIQNRLSDLATLVKFIRAYPYTDTKQFETDISHLWKYGDKERALKGLKHLSSCLLLRRPKGIINLPPRHDKLRAVDFSREERAVYEEMRQQTIQTIDDALHSNSSLEVSKTVTYINVLHQIESLRLFCNLGLRYHTRHDKPEQKVSDSDSWTRLAQHVFNIERQRGPIICFGCSSAIELTETLMVEADVSSSSPQFYQCLKFLCGDCARKLNGAGHSLACRHNPPCPTAPVSISNVALEEHPSSVLSGRTPAARIPSKIKAFIADIKSLGPGIKSILFSTWRLTLDVVEEALENEGIRSLRFDGKVSQKDRQAVVERFRSDPTISVMLLTLSCGAVGLTLTVASRAYLMEPHWNPNIEEQALARVHRIGQTREVTTVRLYMRDSFEKRVMEVQETKRQLAGLLLSPHDGGQVDDRLESLEKLRSLL